MAPASYWTLVLSRLIFKSGPEELGSLGADKREVRMDPWTGAFPEQVKAGGSKGINATVVSWLALGKQMQAQIIK